MRIYESFDDVSEFMSRERVVSPLLDEQTSEYAQSLRMSNMSMTPWKPVQGDSGVLRAWLMMDAEMGVRSVDLRSHALCATPVRMKSGETAYWVDVYVCAFRNQENIKEAVEGEDNREEMALHPRNFHTLSKEYYWPRRYWLAWAWVFSDPMAWHADIEYGGFEIDPRRYVQAFEKHRSSEKTYERARFIWGGYAGQGYDVKVERYFQEHDVKLLGSSSRVPLGGGVEVVVYAHPDVLPSLSIRSSLTCARVTERVLGALRRGRDLQALLERL